MRAPGANAPLWLLMRLVDDEGARRPDVAVARIAASQHGVVTAAQLRAAGLSPTEIAGRAARGLLHPLHQGVYAVGHPGMSSPARWMAAVLACQTDSRSAFLSHRSAAVLLGLLDHAEGPLIDVSVRGYGGRRRRQGIRLHRSETLGSEEVGRRDGIPATSPARTISDLARAPRRERLRPERLRRARRQAAVLGYDLGADEDDRTRSELETAFLALCRVHRLPAPEVNVRVGHHEADFLWRDRRLIVETDGYRFHRGRVAFESDRRRDLELRLLGFEVVRVTHAQLTDDPRSVARAIRRLIDLAP